MATLPADVTAALASLQARWGAAAPRVAGMTAGAEVAEVTDGALALAPAPAMAPAPPAPALVPRPRLDPDDRVIHTGFAALDAILGPGGLPARPASRSAATARAAGRRSSSGSPPRPRPRARSSPGWTSRAASTRSRRSPAASGSNGSWSSPPRPSTRAWPSVARCWPAARWTCSSSTCPVAGWPPRTSPARIADRLGRLAALARRSETLLVVLEPPGLAGGLATAVAESTGLRLELARRSWIRLGRDIVGQRTEALVARNRYGPPGRRATLRILYAEGGERDACLRRDDLLIDRGPRSSPRDPRTDPPRCDSSTSTGRTSPSSSPGREPSSPSRPARSSWAAGRGIRARSSTRARKPGRWASGAGCRSGAPIGSSLRRPSSTRIPTRTGRPSRPPSRRSRRSARGSPAAPIRPMPRSGCSRSRSTASSRCGDRSRSSSSGWSRRSAGRLGEGTRRRAASEHPGRDRRHPLQRDRGRRPGPARVAAPRPARWRGRRSSRRIRPASSPRIRMSAPG